MDLIPRRTRADLILPQQWGKEGRDQESWPFRGLSFGEYSPFFQRGGREGKVFARKGERKIGERERERERVYKGLDRWLLASTRARLASKMSWWWWRGRIKEERGARNGERQAASRYESSFPTFKSNLRTSNPPRMEVLTGGHLCAPATKSIRTDGREL